MDFYEYWIGRDIDLENIWEIFDEGKGYIEKYKAREAYMLRLHFDGYSSDLPLFDHEAILKTIKGLFHDLKKECLTESEYDHFGPIFLYDVNRGSSILTFLAELKPLVMFALGLAAAILWKWEELEGKNLDNLSKKIDIIKKLYPHASDLDVQNFIKALTFIGRNKVIERLAQQGLKKIEVSKSIFKGKKTRKWLKFNKKE